MAQAKFETICLLEFRNKQAKKFEKFAQRKAILILRIDIRGAALREAREMQFECLFAERVCFGKEASLKLRNLQIQFAFFARFAALFSAFSQVSLLELAFAGLLRKYRSSKQASKLIAQKLAEN